VVSAPVSLLSGELSNRTAAFRKVKLILAALSDLGRETTLVESMHTGGRGAIRRTIVETADLDDRRSVTAVRPAVYGVARLSKALQPLEAPALARRLTVEPAPIVGWIYNSYLFEARFAASLARRGVPYVLELEDLPWTRRSFPFNLKSALDSRLFERTVRGAAAVLCVNADLRERVRPWNERTVLFPPIIDPVLERRATTRPAPFSGRRVKIGYCGGLDVGKGADVLLALIDRLPPHMELHIAGIGPLAEPFARAFATRPDRGRFLGFLPEEGLVDFLCSMDVLVNPHPDIDALSGGVFPFKLFEYIASGAVTVTTRLPNMDDLPLDRLVHFDGRADGLISVLETLRETHDPTVSAMVRREVLRRSGFTATTALIGRVLAGLEPRPGAGVGRVKP